MLYRLFFLLCKCKACRKKCVGQTYLFVKKEKMKVPHVLGYIRNPEGAVMGKANVQAVAECPCQYLIIKIPRISTFPPANHKKKPHFTLYICIF